MSKSNNELGCVDSNLKVFGIDGLRVADMSICPFVPRLVPPKQLESFDGINVFIAGIHKRLLILLDKSLQKRFAWNINLILQSSYLILEFFLNKYM
jgi:hypothetical protein